MSLLTLLSQFRATWRGIVTWRHCVSSSLRRARHSLSSQTFTEKKPCDLLSGHPVLSDVMIWLRHYVTHIIVCLIHLILLHRIQHLWALREARSSCFGYWEPEPSALITLLMRQCAFCLDLWRIYLSIRSFVSINHDVTLGRAVHQRSVTGTLRSHQWQIPAWETVRTRRHLAATVTPASPWIQRC
jgi:hypothetical protein